jgi:hypothetical protein
LMEANGVPGQINLSESTYHRIARPVAATKGGYPVAVRI